jgi:hypothetical protein
MAPAALLSTVINSETIHKDCLYPPLPSSSDLEAFKKMGIIAATSVHVRVTALTADEIQVEFFQARYRLGLVSHGSKKQFTMEFRPTLGGALTCDALTLFPHNQCQKAFLEQMLGSVKQGVASTLADGSGSALGAASFNPLEPTGFSVQGRLYPFPYKNVDTNQLNEMGVVKAESLHVSIDQLTSNMIEGTYVHSKYEFNKLASKKHLPFSWPLQKVDLLAVEMFQKFKLVSNSFFNMVIKELATSLNEVEPLPVQPLASATASASASASAAAEPAPILPSAPLMQPTPSSAALNPAASTTTQSNGSVGSEATVLAGHVSPTKRARTDQSYAFTASATTQSPSHNEPLLPELPCATFKFSSNPVATASGSAASAHVQVGSKRPRTNAEGSAAITSELPTSATASVALP